ncbi:MAG: type II toxin-antitoxin system YoeB family toxin [Candidatus Methanomethylophilaceae archaeon]|nr:type II toxin-antitoxin system YoeB family toxin [Candidatus Methanomethylophilaceae archaeon]
MRDIVEEISEDPYTERYGALRLKGPMEGAVSVRLNREHRMVYQVVPPEEGSEGTVKVIRMYTPYGSPLPPFIL